tara:strand:+ start:6588 stop:7289 length:702 start_codon:yes stop_codon:yes gene_type:complete
MILEICANSYQSAMNAQKAGAHRIELCTELSVGGITPSFGLLKKVLAALTIPVHVLIRPRSGNFTYSDSEFKIMKEDIQQCKDLGCAGIVSGVLHANNTIDIERTKELIALSKPLSFTFHRAFDCVSNPKKALKELIALEIDRVLTSGLEEKAINGIALLKELKDIAKEQLIILPGSGINATNARTFKSNGFKEIHTSASKIIANSNLDLNSTEQTISDVTTITEILNIIKNT